MMRRKRFTTFSIDVWPSFTDVMSSMLLIIIFVLTVFFITAFTLSHFISDKDVTIGKLTAQVQSLMKSLGILTEKNKEYEYKVTDREAQISGLKIKLADRDKRLKEHEFKIEADKKLVEELNQRIEKYLASINALNKKLVDAEAVIAEQETGLKMANDRIEHLSGEMEKTLADKDALSQALDSDKMLIDELNRALTDSRNSAAAKEQAIAVLQLAMEKLQKEVDEIKKLLAEKELAIADYEKKVEELGGVKDENEKIRVKSEGMEVEFLKLTTLLKEKEAEISELKKLQKYRSDFFGKLRELFEGNSDIKIVGDRFVFQAEVLFPKAAALVSDQGKSTLDRFIKAYRDMEKEIPPDINLIIQVEGFTDIDPIATPQFPSNWELSTARAINVVKYFIASGLSPEKFCAAGYGENHPVAEGDSEEAKRQNRRIEIKFTNR